MKHIPPSPPQKKKKKNWHFQLKLSVITPQILMSNLGGVRIFNYLRYVRNKQLNVGNLVLWL